MSWTVSGDLYHCNRERYVVREAISKVSTSQILNQTENLASHLEADGKSVRNSEYSCNVAVYSFRATRKFIHFYSSNPCPHLVVSHLDYYSCCLLLLCWFHLSSDAAKIISSCCSDLSLFSLNWLTAVYVKFSFVFLFKALHYFVLPMSHFLLFDF